MDLPELHDYLKFLDLYPRNVYIRCTTSTDSNALVRGIAQKIDELSPCNIHIFRFEGTYLRKGEGDQLVNPLMADERVVFLFVNDSDLAQKFSYKSFYFIQNN